MNPKQKFSSYNEKQIEKVVLSKPESYFTVRRAFGAFGGNMENDMKVELCRKKSGTAKSHSLKSANQTA